VAFPSSGGGSPGNWAAIVPEELVYVIAFAGLAAALDGVDVRLFHIVGLVFMLAGTVKHVIGFRQGD